MKSLTRTLAVAVMLAVIGVASTGADAAARHTSTAMSKPALIHSHWYQHKSACEYAASTAAPANTHHGVFKPGITHHSMLGR